MVDPVVDASATEAVAGTSPAGTGDFYIASIKHTRSPRLERFITFWRHEDCGYAWVLAQSVRHTKEDVLGHPDYYDNGEASIAVDAETVDRLAVSGDASINYGMAVRNTAANWRALHAARIKLPAPPVTP
jgi:hypothetical protein